MSKTLQIINFFQAPFAVRSGGHSPNPGWSSIQDGILISLEKLNTVSLSKDRTFASVGPGARWGEVFATLDAQQAVVVGTRLPDVGVGGSLLGGLYNHQAKITRSKLLQAVFFTFPENLVLPQTTSRTLRY